MVFADVLSQWKALQGQWLPSIRKGAEIRIVEIDRSGSRVIVENSNNQRKSRSFSELERVFKALRKKGPVHVDSLLGGSGSSRNQPETLFANLASVEWLTVDRRKHLVMRDSSTHKAGSVREVDSVEAAAIRASLTTAPQTGEVEVVLPVADVRRVASLLNALMGTDGIAEGQGEYVYRIGAVAVRVVRESMVDEAIRGGGIVRTRGLSDTSGGGSVQIAGKLGRVIRLTDRFVIVDEEV